MNVFLMIALMIADGLLVCWVLDTLIRTSPTEESPNWYGIVFVVINLTTLVVSALHMAGKL